jgi:hypothetical protein
MINNSFLKLQTLSLKGFWGFGSNTKMNQVDLHKQLRIADIDILNY